MTPEQFVSESNKIEGIIRNPKPAEMMEFKRFMRLGYVTVEDMQYFVKVYQCGARLRDKPGLDVRVGDHYPPRGGPEVAAQLKDILDLANDAQPDAHRIAFDVHLAYENLHPFTDGNGRSGRMLWAWMMQDISLGFLHRWYYQSLSQKRI